MRKHPWIAMAFCAMLALTACREESSGQSPAKGAMIVRVYPVPPQRAEAIRNALAEVLAGHGEQAPTGRASLVDGRIVVLAPSATQGSVAEAIKVLMGNDNASQTADVAPVRLRFWFLRSTIQPGDGTEDGLSELQPVLEEARKSMGQGSFRLVDFAELRMSPGSRGAKTKTASMNEINARLTPARNDILLQAEVWAQTGGTGFRTETLLKPGEFIVLSTASEGDAANRGLRWVVVQALRDGKG